MNTITKEIRDALSPDETWAMWSALGTWAAVLVAIVGAGFIVWQIRQTGILAEERARPYVVVWVEVDTETRTVIEMHIKNIGQTAARNVRVKLNPAYEWQKDMGTMRFMDAGVFKEGLPTMAPNWGVSFTMEFVKELMKASNDDINKTMSITATVTYEGRRERALMDSFVLDLAYLRGALWLERHGIHHLAKSIRAIARDKGIKNF